MTSRYAIIPINLIRINVEETTNKKITIGVYIIILLVSIIAGGIIWYLLLDTTPTEKIKNMMIIIFTTEIILIGFSFLILVLQVAKMFNLVQNEIKPLLVSVNETMNTVKGTALFITDSIAKPVLQFNSYFAGFKKLMETISALVGKI